MVRCFTLPDLYAGTRHALVCRNWQRRVKGRYWYSFEWYVRYNVPFNFNHLQARIKEFGGEDVSREQFMEQLRNELATTDCGDVKKDVLPYIGLQQREELDI